MESTAVNGDNDTISISSGEFSDDSDFVDSISDSELIPDLLSNKPERANEDVSCVVIIDGLPIVGPEKSEKLKNLIKSKFVKFGEIISEYVPEKDGSTMGYLFLTYQTPQQALEAVHMMNGKAMDKAHTFLVNILTDYEKSVNVSNHWTPPPKVDYVDKGNLKYFVMDEACRDQFAVVYGAGETTAVYWHGIPEPVVIECRNRWTEAGVRWSSRGTYLATTHTRGIALWGSEAFVQITKFPHQSVSLIDFSPCEKYMVTFSHRPDNPDDPHAIIIWDATVGKKGRGFHHEVAGRWPVFKWSSNDKYFARLQEDMISVYETPSFGLVDKKSIKIPGVEDFSWSPTDDIFAYWVPESDNSPARVVLMEMPSRREICTKNLFSVAKIEMIWQASGDFLCVLVERYAKKKVDAGKQVKYIGSYFNFEIFRIREKQIPVDKLEVKETVTKFQWEPVGSKFAYIQGDQSTGKSSVAFYDVKTGGALEEIKTLDRTSTKINELHWSPKGQYIVLAGLKSAGGNLDFVDATDATSIVRTEHMMASELHWDSTGRYVATVVTWLTHKQDNGVYFWSCVGRLLFKLPMDKLITFSWRPRPPTLLTDKQIKELKKSMKKYTAKFEMEDKMMLSRANKELLEKRRKLLSEFTTWRQALKNKYDKEKPRRVELRGKDTDKLETDSKNLEEEKVEFLVSLVSTVEKRNFISE